MTQLLHRLPSPLRMLRATPLRALTGVAIAMAAVAVYTTSLALERLLFGLSLDDDSLHSGVELPARAFDGSSSGTITFTDSTWRYSISGQDINVGSSTAESLRAIVLPYYWSEFINALLVLALAAVVLLLCIGLLRGGPFIARTTRSLAAFSVLLAVGSIVSQVVRRASSEAEGLGVASVRDQASYAVLSAAHPELGIYFENGSPYRAGAEAGLDLFPLGIAILIAVIAGAFWLGHRMQRDTEGLV